MTMLSLGDKMGKQKLGKFIDKILIPLTFRSSLDGEDFFALSKSFLSPPSSMFSLEISLFKQKQTIILFLQLIIGLVDGNNLAPSMVFLIFCQKSPA